MSYDLNYRKHLWDVLYREHGITALESQLDEIVNAVHRDEQDNRRAFCKHENKTDVISLNWTTKHHCPDCDSYFYISKSRGNITYVMKGSHKVYA